MTETATPETEKKGGILTDNGKGSFSRVSGLLIIVVFLAINIISVYQGGKVSDLPMGWMLTVLILYGFSKLAEGVMGLMSKGLDARIAAGKAAQ